MVRIRTILFALGSVLFQTVSADFPRPDVLVEPLSPRGFRVSIPDQDGIRLFAFHGKINEDFDGREIGDYAQDITAPQNGRWTYFEKTATLLAGDTIYFWIYVDYFDGERTLGHTFEGSHVVSDFVRDDDPEPGPFKIPEITIEALSPRGLRASIPGEEGIKLFAFHVNVNKPMNGREAGEHTKDILKVKNGRFTFLDKSIRLKKGDTIYYWYYVLHTKNNVDNLGYAKYDQSFKVQTLVHDDSAVTESTTRKVHTPKTTTVKTTTLKPGCEATATKINGGRSTCEKKLLFQENFAVINPAKWETEVQYAEEPDYEFNSYSNNPYVISTKKNLLHIKPVLADDIYGSNYTTGHGSVDLGINCTGEVGSRACVQNAEAFVILPPVVSGRINTSPHFSFKYGIVEVRAKMPKGDWVYPEIALTPKNHMYGSGLESGKIRVAFVPGNVDLSRKLSGGIVLGDKAAARTYGMKTIESHTKNWNEDFNVFSVKWKPDGISVYVNDEVYGNILPPPGGFASLEGSLGLKPAATARWKMGTSMAPFDQEMILSIGVGVGGFAFPEPVEGKPYVNGDPKSQRKFYSARDTWKRTWTDETELQVDYVKIWAL